MSLLENAPSQWSTFEALTKQHMPTLPQMGQTQIEENRETLSRVLSVISTLCAGLNLDVPAEIAQGFETTGALTANSAFDAVSGVVEGRLIDRAIGGTVLERVAGGTIIGGGLATVRGGSQQLNRSHELLGYVLGMKGFVTTLATLSLTSLMTTRRDTVYPNPPIPADVMNDGDLFTVGRRAMYMDGVNRAWRVISGVDNLTPADPSEMYYSKGCLIHIAVNATNRTRVGSGAAAAVMRQKCERLIATEIMQNNLQAQREQLRRWARS